jgi:hypothetical protein
VTRAASALALWLALAAGAARAVELDAGEFKFDLTGNLREVLTDTRAVDASDVFPPPGRAFSLGESASLLSTTRLRIGLEGRYGDHWSGQLVYDNELYLGSGRDSLAFRTANALGSPTFLDLDQTLVDSDDATWRHLLYRGWVRYQNDDFDVTLGRQRIALGRGRLWTPSDIFNFIPPLAVEADQRIGVDSLLARAKLADGLWAEVIAAPERHDHHPRSALRLELGRRQLDAAVMVAKIDRDYLFGADFATNLADAALRGEITETWHQQGKATLQAVLSLDDTLPLGTGLYVLVEHFYNQNVVRHASVAEALRGDLGLQGLALRFAPLPQLVTFVRNQTGFELGYDLTPLLRADLLWLHDWNGPSEALVPSITWSARQNLDLSLGVQLFGGNSGTGEYGGLAPLWFLRSDVYF